MTQSHPELAAEQDHVDRAYRRLDESRAEAKRLRDMVEVGAGGTNQARYEREVITDQIVSRLSQLDIGERSLCFGRIDQHPDAGGGSYHIGRVAVADHDHEPLIVDWRAPVAEAFYRATGAQAHGLVRRRHFISRGRQVLGLEDEFFGDAAGSTSTVVDGRVLQGHGALVAALETGRTGQLGDIVGTIQAEQDEIIRAPLPGVLIVQGGPGTGKTVVALHRAAYLLYEHRFPLEGQGVLVVGPNRLFLGYIEQVLPSLGEAGVELAVLADLVPRVRVMGRDAMDVGRIKGDLRMVHVIRRALRDRQRPLRRTAVFGMGARRVRLGVAESESIVAEARRRFRTHNAARKFVINAVCDAIAATHPDGTDAARVHDQLASRYEFREAINWMWPLLTPAQLLHDLFGSTALIKSAGRGLSEAERGALFREWAPEKDADAVVWSVDDVPLLDEALELLGPRPKSVEEDEIRTYGHIVVDEAQDLSPMQLRMLTRRSLNGSMTVVGDIAQSTGAWAHNDWSEVLDHLPDRRAPRRAELTVGYRIPGPTMDLAAKVLAVAAPDLAAPVAVRSIGEEPLLVEVPRRASHPGDLSADASQAAGVTRVDGSAGVDGSVGDRAASASAMVQLCDAVIDETLRAQQQLGQGNVAMIVSPSVYEPLVERCEQRGVPIGLAMRDGLDQALTVVPVGVVKGLEVDVAVVVEPQRILDEEPQGARSLYVALTRATKRIVVVHQKPLPKFLIDPLPTRSVRVRPALSGEREPDTMELPFD